MKSLLSILSHVVHGYVGNRATVFPLQYAGWDVDAINTTNFSNHPGYGSLSGTATPPEAIQDIILGLKQILDFNNVYDIILTGYTPNAEVLQILKSEIEQAITNSRNKPHWIVDPVLGDNGKLYVKENLIPVYRDIFASGLVELTTPNQFEFETLSGVKIVDWSTAKDAIYEFRKLYKVKNIVISSVSIDDHLYCVGSSNDRIFYISIEQIGCSFNGCGDLFTALLADEFYNGEYVLSPQMLSKVLYKLHKILEFSYDDIFKRIGQIPTVEKDIRVVAAKEFLTSDYKLDTDVIYL